MIREIDSFEQNSNHLLYICGWWVERIDAYIHDVLIKYLQNIRDVLGPDWSRHLQDRQLEYRGIFHDREKLLKCSVRGSFCSLIVQKNVSSDFSGSRKAANRSTNPGITYANARNRRSCCKHESEFWWFLSRAFLYNRNRRIGKNLR